MGMELKTTLRNIENTSSETIIKDRKNYHPLVTLIVNMSVIKSGQPEVPGILI